ncbi:unnamed protein product [Prorocentrum cordatum]|uniref:Uncharacterized protein n=1 Tax=Prorocentrum cordatum TaxID=2364126 RepID=A0ABN9QVX3_9DINO|nr:unnamed protein product [Polarella glacialis]|mmetsp:Transcript_119239/g.315193  ORF Transcript_119239/g.315193 Transcript_119239/m.315193 type:complete len:105 (-) Transcript_119239:332-646(-)
MTHDEFLQYVAALQQSPLQQQYLQQYYAQQPAQLPAQLPAQQYHVQPAQHLQYYVQQAPAQTTMVYLPADAFPGMTCQVQAGGRLVSFEVPAGCGPGSAVQVSY